MYVGSWPLHAEYTREDAQASAQVAELNDRGSAAGIRQVTIMPPCHPSLFAFPSHLAVTTDKYLRDAGGTGSPVLSPFPTLRRSLGSTQRASRHWPVHKWPDVHKWSRNN